MKRFKKNLPQIALSIVLALFTVTCTTDDFETTNIDTEASLYEFLLANSRSDFDKRSPQKGSDAIATIAIDAGFNELVTALMYVDEKLDAGLVDLFLLGKDQYTVFAPTDEAFMNLYDTLSIDNIRELPADLVLNVLLYHVTEGRRATNSVVPKSGMRKIETLYMTDMSSTFFSVHPDLTIEAIGSSANIIPTAFDISASNGIIHVIDEVLLPF